MIKTVVCKDVFGKEYIVDADDLEQRIGVYAVIIKDGKILLTRQWDGYSLVGGGVDKGETLEEAFVREVKEETGLDALPDRMIYYTTTFFKKDEASNPKQSFQFYFTQKSVEGDIRNDSITVSEGEYTNGAAEWVSLEDARGIELRHSVDIITILGAYETDSISQK
jgi:8-oxo-dGTP diphosphatase